MSREVERRIARGSVHVVGHELHVRVRGEKPEAWVDKLAEATHLIEVKIEDCANAPAAKRAVVTAVVFLFDYVGPLGQMAKLITIPVSTISGQIWGTSLLLRLTPAHS